MSPYDGEPRQGFHRDRPHWEDHPLRMDYLQLMVYLTDVDEGTHCFSISPESVDEPILEAAANVERNGSVDIHGPAGTVVLFNIAVPHTATTPRHTARAENGSSVLRSPFSPIPERLLCDTAAILASRSRPGGTCVLRQP